MEKDQLSRKLAVILHADVVGSASLVQQNETLARERIQAAFNRFSRTIGLYGGSTREVRGDALVAEFDRASDAVSAALAFQIDQADQNSYINDNLRPEIRAGIAIGEVVFAEDTVTGSGVVLAQRVEQLADRTELEVKQLRGDLIPADAVLAAREPIVGATRSKLLAIPGKLKTAIPNLTDQDLAKVRTIVRGVLMDLANSGGANSAMKSNSRGL